MCKENLDNQVKNNNEILNDLRKYKKHVYCNCLECGYGGLMGVVKKQPLEWWKVLVVVILLLIIGLNLIAILISNYVSIFYYYLVGQGVLCIILLLKSGKNIVHCPHCGKMLSIK